MVMALKPVSPSPKCSCFTSSLSSSRTRKYEMDGSLSLIVLSSPFVSKSLLRSQSFNKISRGHTIRRSCSLNSDNVYRREPLSFRVEGLAKNSGGSDSQKSKNSSFLRDQDSFLNSRVDFLEPMLLGIRPEFSDWRTDHETVIMTTIEQKANSLDIPLSLKMIKKKMHCKEGFIHSKEPAYCSLKAAFSSMVYIIVELQSSALHMRGALCHGDLEIITSKVQKEMHSSFVWLFQQVFSRTPNFMLHVMILLANFGLYSASHDIAVVEALLSSAEREIQHYPQIDSSLSSSVTGSDSKGVIEEKTQTGNLPRSSEHSSIYPGDQMWSVAEMNLWNSILDDARKMREGIDDKILDHDTMQHFVSPVSAEIETDGYEDYLRTDLLYQMNLSREPNNPLLLCNYAQFLHLVVHDYQRAEECFKQAAQSLPRDPESTSQYANFLWTVKRDYLEAEQRFVEALSMDPDNPYYASRYANFLWSTGGEETCFPLNNPHTPNL